MKRYIYILLLMCIFNTNKAQLLYYQNTYNGGASFDGATYIHSDWQQQDIIHFQNSVPSGCTLKKAFLISLKITCGDFTSAYDTPLSFNYNNQTIHFDTTNTITPTFIFGNSPFLGYGWMCVKDVTALTQNNNNVLVSSLQSYSGNVCNYYYYDGFYLLLLYENSTYNKMNIALFLCNGNIPIATTPIINYSLNNLNPININNDVGLSIESVSQAIYQLSSASNTVTLGELNSTSWNNAIDYRTGLGSFSYENGILSGLVDDSPDGFIDTTDALANIKTYLPNNATNYNVTINTGTLNTQGNFDAATAFITTYNTPCPVTPTNTDSTKTYTFCNNANVQLQATTGYTNYNWFPATGLNNPNIANPVVNTTNSTNYICYIKDNTGCMHTEHTQIIVHQTPMPQKLATTTAICGGTQGTLSIMSNPNNYDYLYSLNNGAIQTSTTFTNLAKGQYTLTVEDNTLGCIYTTTLSLKDTNLAHAAFYVNPSSGCAPFTISCQNLSNNISNVTNAWVWYTNGDSATTQGFNYTFLDTGRYVITLLAYETTRNCSATATQTITVNYCPPDSFNLIVPNVFSPNGDDINETWQLIVNNYQYTVNSFEVTIYDRWGIKVFETDNIQEVWSGRSTSGTACNAGSYFYMLSYKATGNTKGNLKQDNLKGYITLLL